MKYVFLYILSTFFMYNYFIDIRDLRLGTQKGGTFLLWNKEKSCKDFLSFEDRFLYIKFLTSISLES